MTLDPLPDRGGVRVGYETRRKFKKPRFSPLAYLSNLTFPRWPKGSVSNAVRLLVVVLVVLVPLPQDIRSDEYPGHLVQWPLTATSCWELLLFSSTSRLSLFVEPIRARIALANTAYSGHVWHFVQSPPAGRDHIIHTFKQLLHDVGLETPPHRIKWGLTPATETIGTTGQTGKLERYY